MTEGEETRKTIATRGETGPRVEKEDSRRTRAQKETRLAVLIVERMVTRSENVLTKERITEVLAQLMLRLQRENL